MLNENNVQASLNYNGTTGKPTLVGITGSFKLELSKRVVWQDSSECIAVDLGYSIDGKFENWIFKIDNKILKIKVVTFRNNIADNPIPENEVVIVSNDPNFRSTVFLSRKNIDKLLYYEITTVNSTLSAWMMDEIAFKLNRFDPVRNTADITDLKGRMQLAENDLDVLDVDLRELENKVNSLDERLTETESKISIADESIKAINQNIGLLEGSISNLKTKTDTLDTRTGGISRTDGITTITDSLKASNTLEVIGKSTMKDIEVKGNIEVAGDSSVKKLTATEINTPVVKNGDYKALFFREGTVQNTGGLINITIEVFINGVNKKIVLKGNYIEYESKTLNNNEYYLKEITLPFTFDSISRSVFRQTIDAVFNLGSEKGSANDKIKLGYRNVAGGTENIAGKTRDFVIEGICNNIDSVAGITWIA